MLKYTVRRLLTMIFPLICVSFITFSMMHLVPGDPALIVAGHKYGDQVGVETLELVREELGLNKHLLIQYSAWLKNLLKGDLGYSYTTDLPVWDEILNRLQATIELAFAAMLIALLISIPLGIYAALKHNAIADNVSMLIAISGASMPNFWLGIILISFFSIKLGWLPVYGRQGLASILLPAITLGTSAAGVLTRLVRSSMLEIMNQDYIKTAYSKGLNEGIIISKHALKNAFIPVLTIIGLQFGALLEGAVVVEVIFSWPGMGRLLIDAIFARNIPVIQGCILFITIIYLFINLLVDILYAWLNPKINYEVN